MTEEKEELEFLRWYYQENLKECEDKNQFIYMTNVLFTNTYNKLPPAKYHNKIFKDFIKKMIKDGIIGVKDE